MQRDRLLKTAWGIAALLFLIQFAPFIFRSDAYLRIHDTLEGEWMWYAAIIDNGVALNYDMSTNIDQWMGGLPRYLFPTGISFTALFIYLFGTIGGYMVSSLLIDMIGFAGCYLLFRKYVFTGEGEGHWPVLIAALFSIIPFFTTFGISIAGLPLLLLAFLNILHGTTRKWEYAFIIFFPFYSNIVWSALFVNAMLLAVLILNFRKRQKLPVYLGMLVVMNVIYVAVNYHLIYAMFISDLVLQREAYDPVRQHPRFLLKSLGETAYMFMANHYHVGTMVNLPILLLAIPAFRNKHVRQLLGLAFFIALLNGFYVWIVPLLEDIHPMVLSFRISRVKMLLPFIWMGILAFSIKELTAQPYAKALSLFTIGALCISTLFANDEILNNYRNVLGFKKKPDAGEFYAKATWQEIDEFIGKDKADYRVVHLGLNPSISLYNGFQTIDGLQAVYPLEHKDYMVSVMRSELEEDEALLRYINTWGNRCYLFSAELGKEHEAFMIDRTMDKKVDEWNINTNLLRDREVEYILSSVKIGNSEALEFQLEKVFAPDDGFWRVYLYKVRE